MKHPSDMTTPRFDLKVVVICGPTRYQFDHGGVETTLGRFSAKRAWAIENIYRIVKIYDGFMGRNVTKPSDG